MSAVFAQRIRDLRIEKGLSQPQLADRVGIDTTYLSKIENGRVPPPSESVIGRLAEALACNREELVLSADKFPATFIERVRKDSLAADFLRKARGLTKGQRRRVRQIIDEPQRS